MGPTRDVNAISPCHVTFRLLMMSRPTKPPPPLAATMRNRGALACAALATLLTAAHAHITMSPKAGALTNAHEKGAARCDWAW
jgi:hypothetical protein